MVSRKIWQVWIRLELNRNMFDESILFLFLHFRESELTIPPKTKTKKNALNIS